MNYDDWKSIGKVAEFSHVEEIDGANVLAWNIVESGEISANTPYLFKPNAIGPVTFTSEDVTLEAAIEGSVGDGNITITGIYNEKTDMMTSGAYGLHQGIFYRASSEDQTLAPYQIYLMVNSSAEAPLKVIRNGIGGNGTTSIMIICNGKSSTRKLYDLQGRFVSAPYNCFVIDDDKIIIKK